MRVGLLVIVGADTPLPVERSVVVVDHQPVHAQPVRECDRGQRHLADVALADHCVNIVRGWLVGLSVARVLGEWGVWSYLQWLHSYAPLLPILYF